MAVALGGGVGSGVEGAYDEETVEGIETAEGKETGSESSRCLSPFPETFPIPTAPGKPAPAPAKMGTGTPLRCEPVPIFDSAFLTSGRGTWNGRPPTRTVSIRAGADSAACGR